MSLVTRTIVATGLMVAMGAVMAPRAAQAQSETDATTPPPVTPPVTPPPVGPDRPVDPPLMPPPPIREEQMTPVAPLPSAQDLPSQRPVQREQVKGTGPRLGTALTVGGGFVDFTGDNVRDMTTSGGYWNARVISGTRRFVGAEAAYVGSARDVRSLGLSNEAMLISNGVEGALRLNIPVIRGSSIVEPFAFAGVGWSRYNIARSSVNTSSLASSDDIIEIPYGGGLSIGYGGALIDARFTYRSTYFNDMMRTPSGSYGRLDNWSLGAQAGWEY